MLSQAIIRLLSEAHSALVERDKATFDHALYAILKADIHMEEAWALLYAWYGKGRPYEQFKTLFIRENFPDQVQPSKDQSGSVRPPVSSAAPVDTPQSPSPAPVSASTTPATDNNPADQAPQRYHCDFCGLPFDSPADVNRHAKRWHPMSPMGPGTSSGD